MQDQGETQNFEISLSVCVQEVYIQQIDSLLQK